MKRSGQPESIACGCLTEDSRKTKTSILERWEHTPGNRQSQETNKGYQQPPENNACHQRITS
jgi:recombinational DNA repair protein RecT